LVEELLDAALITLLQRAPEHYAIEAASVARGIAGESL